MTMQETVKGFITGICTHIAIEKTGNPFSDERTIQECAYLMYTHKHILSSMFDMIDSRIGYRQVIDHLNNIALDSIDDSLLKHIPHIAGYVIGASVAGYTLVCVADVKNALDVRTGEFWVARFIDEEINKTKEDYLARIASREGEPVYLRWSADKEYENGLKVIQGLAIPREYPIPLCDFDFIREAEKGIQA